MEHRDKDNVLSGKKRFPVALWGVVLALMASSAPVWAGIRVDGRLDEPEWQRVPHGAGWTVLRTEARLPKYPVTQFAARDDHTLYLAVACAHPDLDNLDISHTERDGPTWMDEGIEVFLQPDTDGPLYYHLAVNAEGVLYDREFGGDGVGWNHPGIRTGTQKLPEHGCYVIELAIPFEDWVEAPAEGDRWGFNIIRTATVNHGVRQLGEISSWCLLESGAHEPWNFGRLVFEKEGLSFSRPAVDYPPATFEIPNGSFEQGLAGWKPVAWVGTGRYPQGRFESVATDLQAFGGTACLQITGRDVGPPLIERARGGVWSTPVTLPPGRYALVGYYRTEIEDDMRMDGRYVDVHLSNNRLERSPYLPLSPYWARFETLFEVLPGEETVRALLRVWGDGTLWFDNLRLEPAPEGEGPTGKDEPEYEVSKMKVGSRTFDILTAPPEPCGVEPTETQQSSGFILYHRMPPEIFHPRSAPQAEEVVPELSIACARDEYESTLVAAYALRNVAELEVAVDSSEETARAIPSEWLELYEVPFWLQRTGYANTQARLMPELLRPVETGQRFDLEQGRTRIFWVTVHVPDAAEPGDYTGTLCVRSAAGAEQRVALRLHVHDFDLEPPAIPVGLWASLDAAELAFMRRYGLTVAISDLAFDIRMQDGKVTVGTGEAIERVKRYLQAGMQAPMPADAYWASTTLAQELGIYDQIPKDATHDASQLICPGTVEEYPEVLQDLFRETIRQICAAFETEGLKDTIVFYPTDEPTANPHRMPKALVEGRLVHEAAPWARTFMTVHDMVRTRQLRGALDIPCVSLGNLTLSEKWNRRFREMAEESGMEIWCYGGSTDETYAIIRRQGIWAEQSGAQRLYCWMSHSGEYSNPDEPLNDLLGNLKRCSTYYPHKNGEFLSTIQYEGLREAVDDLRYLATARKKIAALASSRDPASREQADALAGELRGALGDLGDYPSRTHEESEAVRAALVRIIQSVSASTRKK